MIQRVDFRGIYTQQRVNTSNNIKKSNVQINTNPINYDHSKLTGAYQGLMGIKTAKTVSFGRSLSSAFKELRNSVYTCKHDDKSGEYVGWHIPVTNLIDNLSSDLPDMYDAIKTNIVVNKRVDEDDNNVEKLTDARTQLKKLPNGILYEMDVRPERNAPANYKNYTTAQI